MPQGYNEDDFAEMQRQAIKRVKEMQQRAKPAASLDEDDFKSALPEGEAKEDKAPKQSRQIEKAQTNEAPKPMVQIPKQTQHSRQRQANAGRQPKGLSSLFKLDSDVSLILPLLLLLGREDADEILLLALLYIMA